ncbi:MAG: PEP-utilizing enzyme, partial [Cloacibacillus evryensis]
MPKNERMRERAADLEDVCRQLLRAYVPEDDRVSEEEPVVIAAIDLLPSDTARLDFSLVKGIITEVGGMTSHSSIIARSHGIPEVTGISDLLRVARDGQAVILDADQGLVIFDPGKEEWNAYKDIPAQQKEEKRRDEEFLARPCLTANGEPIAVGANIGSDRPEELARCESAD